MRGCPQFSFWILIAFAKICFFHIVMSRVKTTVLLVGQFLYRVEQSRPQSCDPFGYRHGSRALAESEAGSPRITDFRLSAQPQEFETITVTIGYKNGQLMRLPVILAPAKALDPWRWPKGSQLWGRE